jgi:uncharacterized protein (TIGR00369 family)
MTSFSGSNFVGRGFPLTFTPDENNVMVAEFVFDLSKQGPPNIVHGGATCAALDEAMTAAMFHHQHMAMTVHMEVNWKAPIRIGDRVTIRGWLVKQEGRKLSLEASIHDSMGVLCASGSALFIVVTDGKQ